MLSEKNFELKPMTVVTLKVVRENELGAFLDAGTGKTSDDILLHKTQQTAEVKLGDSVEVFLYLDPKRRLTASMRIPKMRVGQIARLKVIGVTKDGAFLDVGAERGIFMPFAEMRGRVREGDVVWARLYTDKSGRLAVSMKVSDEIRRASKPAKNVRRGDKLTGEIFNITEAGAFMFSQERYIVFLAQKEIPRPVRVGETIEARVTFVREDGRLDASLREPKENAILIDAEKILNFLRSDSEIILSDRTSPEKIQEIFHISKAAFKRAAGHLLKIRAIEKTDGGFKLSQ